MRKTISQFLREQNPKKTLLIKKNHKAIGKLDKIAKRNQIKDDVLEFIKTKRKTVKTQIQKKLKISYYELTKAIDILVFENRITKTENYFYKFNRKYLKNQ